MCYFPLILPCPQIYRFIGAARDLEKVVDEVLDRYSETWDMKSDQT